jgi:hypothetical protein
VAFSVEVNLPNRPKGDGIEILGLGVFPNGETTEISDEQMEYFRVINTRLVDVDSEDRPAFTGAAGMESRQGPDAVEAFKEHPHISVSKIAQKPKSVSKPASKAQKDGD